MPPFIDLVGQTFGRLTVVSRASNLKNNVAFNCLCTCGRFYTIRARSLKAGSTQSCGCLKKESIIARGQQRRLTETEREISKERKRELARRRVLEREFNTSPEEFEAKRVAQNNRCAICNEVFAKTPHQDHAHITGQPRGLLCGRCNPAIGLLREDPKILRAAIAYLNSYVQ